MPSPVTRRAVWELCKRRGLLEGWWGADLVDHEIVARTWRSYAVEMDATVLDVITALLSLVAAVGVLMVNAKVDRLSGRVEALQSVIGAIIGRDNLGR